MPTRLDTAAPLPPHTPFLVFPIRDLMARGVMASPFLRDSEDLSSIAMVAIGNTPTRFEAGELVATAIPIPTPHSYIPDALAVEQPMAQNRPLLTFQINKTTFLGLLDTGADVSVIQAAEWPDEWPTESAPAVRGVGGIQNAVRSKHWLSVTSPDVTGTAYFQPLILPLHTNLWGRDLMSQFHTKLTLQ